MLLLGESRQNPAVARWASKLAILALTACSSATSDAPAAGTAADAGVLGADAGSSRDANDGGSIAHGDGGTAGDGGGVTDAFGGPDTCGDGLDNDGNGVIDDGCEAPACALAIKATYDLPGQRIVSDGNVEAQYVAFDHAHHQIVSIGGADGYLRAYAESDGTLLATSGSDTLTAINLTNGIVVAHGAYQPYFYSSTADVHFDALLHPTLVTPAAPILLDSAYTYSGGALYSGYLSNKIPATGDVTFYSYDAALTQTGPMALSFSQPAYSVDIEDAGGLPIWNHFNQQTTAEVGQYVTSELVALGPHGVLWRAAGITDTWSGYSGLMPTAIVRHEDRLLFCQGGAEYPVNSGSRAHDGQMTCHVLDAKTGAVVGASSSADFPGSPLDHVSAVSFGDGWLVLRSDSSIAAPMKLEIEHVARDGSITKNLFSSTGEVGAEIVDVQELGPDSFGVLFVKADQTARVAIFGCQ